MLIYQRVSFILSLCWRSSPHDLPGFLHHFTLATGNLYRTLAAGHSTGAGAQLEAAGKDGDVTWGYPIVYVYIYIYEYDVYIYIFIYLFIYLFIHLFIYIKLLYTFCYMYNILYIYLKHIYIYSIHQISQLFVHCLVIFRIYQQKWMSLSTFFRPKGSQIGMSLLSIKHLLFRVTNFDPHQDKYKLIGGLKHFSIIYWIILPID